MPENSYNGEHYLMSDVYRFNPSAREVALKSALEFHMWGESNSPDDAVVATAEKFVKFLDAE
ncbi:hypothetical protein MINTM005_13610 [Mycobacterium intracellulare]|nr:hypothetical protein MINTM005_13610 [Mycobacterium intracellulare]